MKILGNKIISECTAYDFKDELERKKISQWLKSVSAFANTEGGALYFDVSNNGTVTGLKDIQADSDFISEKINAHLDSLPEWTLTPAEDENGNKILELMVKPGQFTPYYLFLDGSRQAYVRSGNESKQATSRQLLNLVLKGTNRSWDALPSKENISKHSFKMLANEYHERTRLQWDDKYPESWGLVMEDGNLLYLLKMMTSFIKSSTAKRWFKLPDYRLNFPEYADRAILECCVNHLIHRDMTEVGSEVHVDIYDNRIEFYSPGGMFDGTRIQDRDILKVPSKRRNPIIADVFTQLDLMEKRGSGFRKITTHTSSFFTTVYSVLYGKTDADFQRIIDQESTAKTGNTTQKTTPKDENSTPKKLGATAQSILDILSEDPYLKREEIATRAGLKLEGLKYQLAQLQKKGYLLRTEGRKTGRWKVLIKK